VRLPGDRRFAAAVRRLDRFIYDLIAARRAECRERGDLLSVLIQARDENGMPMSDRQLRDEIMTLFLAGHETTANALSWTCFLLAQHGEAEEKLSTELERELAGDGRMSAISLS